MLTSSQTLGWWIEKYGSIQDSRDFGGVVPAYPIFMFAGIIAVIIATIIKMRMKKIPLNELYWAILIIVPIGIIGGTIFGKAFIPGEIWYHVFFFWEPGMSLFGAIGLGTVAGFTWFYKRSKKTQISVWVYADCILPNVLLGQAIGRWGNMYNHEIMGNIVDYDALSWLIPGIRDKLFYWDSTTLAGLNKMYNGLPIGSVIAEVIKNGKIVGTEQISVYFPNGGDWATAIQSNLLSDPNLMHYIKDGDIDGLANLMYHNGDKYGWLHVISDPGQNGYRYTYSPTLDDYKQVAKDLCSGLQFREPLFLYESLANTFLWLILTFVVPNLSRWIQPKGQYPWDVKPNAYPGWYNPKVKTLPLDKIQSWSVQRPIKYKKSKDGKYRIGFYEAWNKAYYLYEPSMNDLDSFVQKQDERIETENKLLADLKNTKDKYKSDVYRLNKNFANKTNTFSKQDKRYIALYADLQNDIKLKSVEYKQNKKKINDELGGWQRFFKPVPYADKLTKLENPNNCWVVRSGVLTGAYIFGYMIIRIILETHREAREYFVQNYAVPNFIVLAIILLAGLAIIFIAQFISPYKYREVGWLYEKSY